MRTLSPILNMGYLNSRGDLLYRMDKKLEFLTFFGVKSIEQFLSGIQGCDEVRQFVNVLVSMIFHVTVKNIFKDRIVRSAKSDLVSLIVSL